MTQYCPSALNTPIFRFWHTIAQLLPMCGTQDFADFVIKEPRTICGKALHERDETKYCE